VQPLLVSHSGYMDLGQRSSQIFQIVTIVQPSGIGPSCSRDRCCSWCRRSDSWYEHFDGDNHVGSRTVKKSVGPRLVQFSSLGSLRRRKKHSGPLPANFELHVGRGNLGKWSVEGP
jgi:hypothetical protein